MIMAREERLKSSPLINRGVKQMGILFKDLIASTKLHKLPFE